MERKTRLKRKTKETHIEIELNLDGSGLSEIETGIPFMDHMLTLMAAHGFLDLRVTARGDIEVDNHHTVEDLGIALGKAIHQALGEKQGLRRYGQAMIPMDEALSRVVVDVSNRPFLAYRVGRTPGRTGTFDISLLKEFFRALANNAGITLHVDLVAGEDAHHIAESIFKAFGRALDEAAAPEDRLKGQVPSTKGVL